MLESVKLALRLSGDAFDEEVQGLIDAASRDLQEVGVTPDPANPLVKRAIITYCKSEFGYDNPDAPRFMESYAHLKVSLMLYGDADAT